MAVTRIVLLGKAGSGKSSLRKTLLEESLPKTKSSPNPETSECHGESSILTTVIDTPDFFDTNMPEETLRSETVKCLAQCGPGPHAFLIVLRVDRGTDQNKDIIDKILENLSEEVLKHTVIVFTHGEQLKPGEKIQDLLGMSQALSELVQKCGGRCHIVDNKHWNNNNDDDYRNNKFQVTQLLNTIQKMKQGGGLFQEVEEEKKKERNGFIDRLLCRLIGTLGGTLLGALFGAALCQSYRVKTRFGAGVGAVFGACIGYSTGEQASTPGEAALKTLETVSAVGKGFMQANDALQSGGSKD